MSILWRDAVAPLLCCLLWTLSCSTARINQFQNFSPAGVAYVKAAEALLDEAGDTAIDTDTLLLQKARPSLASGTGKDSRGKTIIDHNQLLRERLSLLSDLRRHASLLQSYFEALGSLSQSDAPSGIGTAAGSVVTALGGLNSKIKNAKVGNLAGAADEEKAQSNKQLLQLQQTRLALGNAVLSDIRDKLVDNEADLQQGIGDVSKALANLEDVAQVLGTVSSLLTTVGKVVSLP